MISMCLYNVIVHAYGKRTSAVKVEGQRLKSLDTYLEEILAQLTSRMAEAPLFSEYQNNENSIELSEIESMCTNCEQNVSFMKQICVFVYLYGCCSTIHDLSKGRIHA